MNWLMTLAQCAHWFDPFIWLTLARMRADREMAADAVVVESAKPGEALGLRPHPREPLGGASPSAAPPLSPSVSSNAVPVSEGE